ncbi:MAG: DUF4163 domain-containing protein [Syntrophomonas sp.]|nr:DUF4163 domain-containing protein [Syntrophomonas sp.]
MHKILPLLLLVILLVFPQGAEAQQLDGDWADVKQHWARQDMEAVISLDLMSGTGENNQGERVFSPEDTVSRAQLSAVLDRAFQLDYGQKRFIKQPLASDYYSDVENEAWYGNSLVMCAINNIFETGEVFSPNQPVTRMEIAQAIYRSFSAKGISVPMIMMMPIYEDTNHLSQEDMNAMVFVSNTGIMKGDNHYFRPEQNMTRAELAAVLMRCVSLVAVDESSSGKNYQVPAGQTFVVALNSNPATGYVWSIKNDKDDKIIAPVTNTYIGSGNQSLVGQGGREYWQFQALETGTTELKMVYSRPWESVQPAQVFNLSVTVIPEPTTDTAVIISNNKIARESDYMSADLNIPVMSGLTDDRIQSEINERWEKQALDLEQKLAADIEAYVQFNQQNDFPIRAYNLTTRYQECYQNHNLLSLYVDYYQYTGGAHGITNRQPYNIDLKSGQELALKDLFKTDYDYQSIINKKISDRIASGPDIYFSGDSGFNGITENQSYYIQEGFLVVYFSQYEIAPYAAGFPEFKIPLSDLQDGVKNEWLR